MVLPEAGAFLCEYKAVAVIPLVLVGLFLHAFADKLSQPNAPTIMKFIFEGELVCLEHLRSFTIYLQFIYFFYI